VELAIGTHSMAPVGGTELNVVVMVGSAIGRPALVSRTSGDPEVLTGQFEPFLMEPRDGGMVASAPESLVGWQQREPMLNGHCSAHSRDHFSLDRLVEGVDRSLTAATGELRGKGWAWT
jgi:hypothetical protein